MIIVLLGIEIPHCVLLFKLAVSNLFPADGLFSRAEISLDVQMEY